MFHMERRSTNMLITIIIITYLQIMSQALFKTFLTGILESHLQVYDPDNFSKAFTTGIGIVLAGLMQIL